MGGGNSGAEWGFGDGLRAYLSRVPCMPACGTLRRSDAVPAAHVHAAASDEGVAPIRVVLISFFFFSAACVCLCSLAGPTGRAKTHRP